MERALICSGKTINSFKGVNSLGRNTVCGVMESNRRKNMHDEMYIAHHERSSLPLDRLCRRYRIEAYRKLRVSRPLRVSIYLLSKVPRVRGRRLVPLAVNLKPQEELGRTSPAVDHNRRRTPHRRCGHLYPDHERCMYRRTSRRPSSACRS